jgi:hypothetical protein
LWQADKLRIRAVNRQRSNDLSRLDSKGAVPEHIYHANQVPPRREGQAGSLGMNAFAHHDVRQGNTRGLYSYPYFIALGLGPFSPEMVPDSGSRIFKHTAKQPIAFLVSAVKSTGALMDRYE